MDLLTINDRLGAYPRSYYAATVDPLPAFQAAKGDLSCDVCVVGAGYMGLSTALHLAERGYDVVLLDAQRIGFGASGRNGGQLGQGQRVEQDALEDLVGTERAHALWTLATQSVDLVRHLAASDEVRTKVHDGVLDVCHRPRYVSEYRDYVKKLQTEYGHEQIRFVDRDECRSLVDSQTYHGGMLDMSAGHLHPLEFALGLARLATKAGVKIFEQSKVTHVTEGDPAKVETDDASISARFVVLGCNGYLGAIEPNVARRVMPINNFIAATEPMTPEQQEQLITGNIAVADSKFVINYFRFSDDHRLLFGGTESYGYRFPNDIAAKVRRPMEDIFPQLKGIGIDYAWGGTLGITMNRMPHYARLAGNILSLSGFSGHGLGMATLSGQIAAETIAGQAERFDLMAENPPPAFPGGAALRSPLLVLAMLWYALRDRL